MAANREEAGRHGAAVEEARILIVDDEPANVRLLERMLQQAGYRHCRGLTDSRETLAAFRELQPDLVLLDLSMPHLDGVAILQQLALEIPAGDYRPVAVLTADVTVEARRRALGAGAKEFLTKPFDQVEVLLRIRNLLETRRLHLALERHSRELEATVHERTAQLLQTQKVAEMGALLAGVAHELNNPLAVVIGQTALLSHSAPDDRVRQRAQKIAGAAERCARIVKNFLALARQRPEQRERAELNRVVSEALELVAYPLRLDDVQVALALDPELPALWADPSQLHQALVNLVTNAHHALREAPPPRRLAIATRHEPAAGRVVVEVADSGPGIPPEIQAKIFEPFFTTKPLGQGTGLGLSLVRGIVEGHGGTIALETAPGRGTKFIIALPAGASAGTVAPVPAVEEAVDGARRPALVVDDEREIADVLAEILQTLGFTVDIAGDGVAALEQIAAHAYDVVLTDLKMPRLDGPGLYRELQRRHPALARRVVFVTGDTLGSTEEFLETLPNATVAKPFDQATVRRALRQALTA